MVDVLWSLVSSPKGHSSFINIYDTTPKHCQHGASISGLFINVVVVDCGLTSHSAIFQLYNDGTCTDVQFPNFDLLPGTHAMGS